MSQEAISKIERQFQNIGHVRQIKKATANVISDTTKLDIMLVFEGNPHTSTSNQKSAPMFDVSYSSISRKLKFILTK